MMEFRFLLRLALLLRGVLIERLLAGRVAGGGGGKRASKMRPKPGPGAMTVTEDPIQIAVVVATQWRQRTTSLPSDTDYISR